MDIKILTSVVALAVGGAIFGGVSHAATESRSETTVERSTVIEPKPDTLIKEETTTTTSKRNILGRKKSETTSTSKVYERSPNGVSEVKSSTTVERKRSDD